MHAIAFCAAFVQSWWGWPGAARGEIDYFSGTDFVGKTRAGKFKQFYINYWKPLRRIQAEDWALSIGGLCENPLTLTLAQLQPLPLRMQTSRMKCVECWSAKGRSGSIYPWGNHPLRKRPHPFYSGVVKTKTGSNKQDVSPYGVHDMAGSVWEWTADSQGPSKIIRGGLWNLHLDFQYSKAYEKAAIPPGERLSFLGFRCVRSME